MSRLEAVRDVRGRHEKRLDTADIDAITPLTPSDETLVRNDLDRFEQVLIARECEVTKREDAITQRTAELDARELVIAQREHDFANAQMNANAAVILGSDLDESSL